MLERFVEPAQIFQRGGQTGFGFVVALGQRQAVLPQCQIVVPKGSLPHRQAGQKTNCHDRDAGHRQLADVEPRRKPPAPHTTAIVSPMLGKYM